MPDPTSVKELDLSPIPGKKYFTVDREWREEFIYFLIVDRFQDDIVRPASGGADRAAGINTPNTFFGGNIKGITRNLDYIAGLGCTAILQAEIAKLLALPDVKARLNALGFDPIGTGGDEFARYIREEMAKYEKIIREAKIKAE